MRACAASRGSSATTRSGAESLRAIELPRIKGGKPFDMTAAWFTDMLKAIGQPIGERVAVKHGGED